MKYLRLYLIISNNFSYRCRCIAWAEGSFWGSVWWPSWNRRWRNAPWIREAPPKYNPPVELLQTRPPKIWVCSEIISKLKRVKSNISLSGFETFLHISCVVKQKMCFSRHVSSFYWHFQVRELILVLGFYSEDVLETFEKNRVF